MAERTLTADEIAQLPREVRAALPPQERSLTPAQARNVGLEVPDAPPPPKGVDPGRWMAFWHSALAGALKQGSDELVGEVVEHAPGTLPGNDTYRKARDAERQVLEASREQHPWLSTLGNLAGDVASDYVLSKVGLPVTSQGYQVTSGALSGLLGGTAELTSDKRTPASEARAALDTGLGAGLAYAAPKVGAAAGRVAAPLLRRARSSLEGVAASMGRRVLQGGSDLASATRREVPDEVILDAIANNSILPFGTTQGALRRLNAEVADRGELYNQILQNLEEVGVQGPEVEPLARQLLDRADDVARQSLGSQGPANAYRSAGQRLENIARGGTGTRGAIGPVEQRLGLQEAEAMKRRLQDEARYGLISDTPLNDAKKEIAGRVREAIDQAVEQAGQAAPPDSLTALLAERFVPAKQSLGRALAGRELAEKGTARIAGRNAIGLRESMLGAMTSGGDPVTGLLNSAGLSLAKSRLPSAGAQGAYWLSRLARAGANHPMALETAGSRAATSLARNPAVVQRLADFLTPVDEDEARLRALEEFVQGEK